MIIAYRSATIDACCRSSNQVVSKQHILKDNSDFRNEARRRRMQNHISVIPALHEGTSVSYHG